MLEIRLLCPELESSLAAFFGILAAAPGAERFHPHPFSADEAARLCNRRGPDLYCVVTDAGAVIAYGMLRGWEEGFTIPSLGIAVDASYRGKGVGELVMHYLHASAKLRGAPRIRLKVYPDNVAALALYRKLGYHFQPELQQDQYVGYLDLH